MSLPHLRRCFCSSAHSFPQPHAFYGFKPPKAHEFESASKKLEKLPLTTLVDALWTLKYPSPMIHGINKITKEPQTINHVGLAITLRFVPFRNDLMTLKPAKYESPEYKAFAMVNSDEMRDYKCSIVMETVGKYESIGGDIKLSMLKNSKNVCSIVCDGGIRDIETVQAYNIPIYASSITCKQGPATQIPWSMNEVVCVGNVVCAPYDYVVADEYNVIVVPQCNVNAVIGIAEVREAIEEIIKTEIEKNSDDTSIIPNYYPFSTPLTEENNLALVELLKKYNRWEHIQSLQNDIFS